MITDAELKISNQSYTQKDFYQIYPALLDLVKEISDRWDPSSSNESDPGVVLLKLLAFIADKNNYNIDKNILECFMPSATQSDSMRKLCDMMGYDMHYYVSATTDVSFMWVGKTLPETPAGDTYIKIPIFSSVSNSSAEKGSKEVNYVLTQPVTLTYKGQTASVNAIEGTLVDFALNDSETVKLYNLDDNRRLYLPETQIAENGIWIRNIEDEDVEDSFWKKSLNLNIESPSKKCWKFGFDSKRKLPYILFPEDISELIGNGLKIRYIRTSGVNGNISAKVLDTLKSKTTVSFYAPGQSEPQELNIKENNNTYLVIQNPSFTLQGKDVETLDDAYEGFKKTIGTFETLVTCRDYANAIYNMVSSNRNTANLVSNVQVSDIRDDINFVNKVVTFDDYGVLYADIPLFDKTDVATLANLPTPAAEYLNKIYYVKSTEQYFEGVQLNTSTYGWMEIDEENIEKKISHFDLYLYPLNPVSSLYVAANYENTFKPNNVNFLDIKNKLSDYKTLSHQIKQVSTSKNSGDMYLLKNYYHLTAKVATSYKVSKYEGEQILNNIYVALYKNFNARELDYGEEIPYDSLVKVMQEADSRIKFVSLEEPKISTKLMMGSGNETDVKGNTVYNSGFVTPYETLVAKNVLAGKLPLFKYDDRFDFSFGKVNISDSVKKIYGAESNNTYESKYTIDKTVKPVPPKAITGISTYLKIPAARLNRTVYTLGPNEVLQLRAKNLNTSSSYQISINYYYIAGNNIPTGVNPTIIANSEYKLYEGSHLYINYTDSSGVVHNIDYKGGTTPTYTDTAEGSLEHEWSGIINSSFDIPDSASRYNGGAGVPWSKKSGYSWAIGGMYTITSSDEINIRNFVSTSLRGTLYCYWSTLNNNTITFIKDTTESTSTAFVYKYTLSSDEYFFYTDSLKNSLLTLGSGTTLSFVRETDVGNSITWELTKSSEIDIDDVASKGIGAFADTQWEIKALTSGERFDIEENQLVILGEKDQITFADGLQSLSASQIDSSTWLSLNNAQAQSFRYNGKSLVKFAGDTAHLNINWYVRAMLNLNMGPETPQRLIKDTGSNPIVRKISLYNNYWYRNGESSDTPISDFSNITNDDFINGNLIEVYMTGNKTMETFDTSTSSNDIYLCSNYVLQQAGNYSIMSAHRYNYAGTLVDDLDMYPFLQQALVSYDASSTQKEIKNFNAYENYYTKLSLTTNRTIYLPTYIPENSFGIFMLYYVKGTGSSDNLYVTVDGDSGANLNFLSFYKDNYKGEAAKYKNILYMKPGINVIRIKQGCTLIIGGDASGSITFSDLRIVRMEPALTTSDSQDTTGVDYRLLGILKANTAYFVEKLQEQSGSEKFFYCIPINNYNRMDINKFDEYAWFNYNNIYNKFTLAEIDTNLGDIEIAKSSRSGQW